MLHLISTCGTHPVCTGCLNKMAHFEYADPLKGESITCPTCKSYFEDYDEDDLVTVATTCRICGHQMVSDTHEGLMALIREHDAEGCE